MTSKGSDNSEMEMDLADGEVETLFEKLDYLHSINSDTSPGEETLVNQSSEIMSKLDTLEKVAIDYTGLQNDITEIIDYEMSETNNWNEVWKKVFEQVFSCCVQFYGWRQDLKVEDYDLIVWIWIYETLSYMITATFLIESICHRIDKEFRHDYTFVLEMIYDKTLFNYYPDLIPSFKTLPKLDKSKLTQILVENNFPQEILSKYPKSLSWKSVQPNGIKWWWVKSWVYVEVGLDIKGINGNENSEIAEKDNAVYFYLVFIMLEIFYCVVICSGI